MAPRQRGPVATATARPDRPRLRKLLTSELTPGEVAAIRTLLEAAFGPDEEERFREEDWQHSVGGLHFVLDLAAEIVAHASVVEREIHVRGAPLRSGYVEAVATSPGHQGRGYATLVMREVGAYICGRFELGALGTGVHGLYKRLGWLTWAGPSSVRAPSGEHRTPDEDGYILVLPTPTSPRLDLSAPISCDWRPGDAW